MNVLLLKMRKREKHANKLLKLKDSKPFLLKLLDNQLEMFT